MSFAKLLPCTVMLLLGLLPSWSSMYRQRPLLLRSLVRPGDCQTDASQEYRSGAATQRRHRASEATRLVDQERIGLASPTGAAHGIAAIAAGPVARRDRDPRSEEHTSEL